MPSWFQRFRERQERRNTGLACEKSFASGRELSDWVERRNWLYGQLLAAELADDKARAEQIGQLLLAAASEVKQLFAAEARENVRVAKVIEKCLSRTIAPPQKGKTEDARDHRPR